MVLNGHLCSIMQMLLLWSFDSRKSKVADPENRQRVVGVGGLQPKFVPRKVGGSVWRPQYGKKWPFLKKIPPEQRLQPPPPLTPPHPSRSATEVSSYRGESEGMPLQTRDAGTMQEYVLPGAHLKPLLLHLQLIHFGWMMHHLRKHSTWLYRFKKMLHQKGIIIILVYI